MFCVTLFCYLYFMLDIQTDTANYKNIIIIIWKICGNFFNMRSCCYILTLMKLCERTRIKQREEGQCNIALLLEHLLDSSPRIFWTLFTSMLVYYNIICTYLIQWSLRRFIYTSRLLKYYSILGIYYGYKHDTE